MANLILAYPNRTDSSTLTGGGWESPLPLDNLKNRLISRVARTVDATVTSSQFTLDYGQIRPTRVVVLVKHNLTISAKWRIRGSIIEGVFTSPVYDSGWIDTWPTLYSTESLEWEDDNFWDGKLSAEEREGFTANAIHVLPSICRARYWRIEIDDESNSSGYIQIGRLFISGQWQVQHNASYGMTLGYESLTEVDKSIGGVEHFDVQPSYRVTKFTLEALTLNEGHQLALEASRSLGISGELFLIPDPDDSINMIRRAFLGRLKTLSPIEYPYYDENTATFEVKEFI